MTQEHLPILRAFDELKFNLGKKTLVDFIKGDVNPTIERNNLDELNAYGCLYKLSSQDLFFIINILIKEGYLQEKSIPGGFKVVERTSLGLKELIEKKFEINLDKLQSIPKISKKFELFSKKTQITPEDEKLFQTFSFFLEQFNPEQKKAILDQSKHILCVAGAGSGKTTVLTKRIEFLTKFKGVNQKEILAITFTKKAKEEMQTRLAQLGITNTRCETFNSFAEKQLQLHSDSNVITTKKVAQFKDKLKIVRLALDKLSFSFDSLAQGYFTKKQLREKTLDELFFTFTNDIFSIIDYYKNKESSMDEFYSNEKELIKKNVAKQMYYVAKFVQNKMSELHLRDFSDQLLELVTLYKKDPVLIPHFKHILVDEYQDVNLPQVQILQLLSPNNMFAVGDPRQAIYGWRGSDIQFIIDFPKQFKDTSLINLQMNYRSTSNIVSLFNTSIKSLGTIDLQAHNQKEGEIFLIEHKDEVQEKLFILESIKNSTSKRCEIFVLARTNKILENYADYFKKHNIPFAIKAEEQYKTSDPSENQIVLATVHSIKGMEAQEVYIVSANSLSFPNKVQDNFVFAMVKQDNNYNKEEEELRLFYVALSRAKQKLVISYTGSPSKFITKPMLEQVKIINQNKSLSTFGVDSKQSTLNKAQAGICETLLKEWRVQKANERSVPAYMIISNKAIEELATRQPQHKEDLYFINGLGEKKISQYGNELLELLNKD